LPTLTIAIYILYITSFTDHFNGRVVENAAD